MSSAERGPRSGVLRRIIEGVTKPFVKGYKEAKTRAEQNEAMLRMRTDFVTRDAKILDDGGAEPHGEIGTLTASPISLSQDLNSADTGLPKSL